MNKLPVFEWFFSMGDVLVSVNTAFEGVVVPPHLKGKENVDFIMGSVPTPNLAPDAEGVTASMRFGPSLHTCRFPWGSVTRMASPEAVIQFAKPQPLKEVESGPEPTEDTAKPAGKKEKKSKGHLRVVK
ncbi:MAG: hypothetical protein HY751_00255 [Nitrospinae bacterium]|nr:hypothetical protein [Nitrospinota bacterium]